MTVTLFIVLLVILFGTLNDLAEQSSWKERVVPGTLFLVVLATEVVLAVTGGK